MKKFEISLDLLIIDIKYSYGHLYWDRCGQTILDIEANCEGWFSARSEKNFGRLENPEKRMILVFDDNSFNLNIQKPGKLDNDLKVEEIKKIWKIIRANFGLEEFNRMACRYHFIKPTTSVAESEKLLENSELNVTIPKHIEDLNYNLNIRQVITIFTNEHYEYRVELKGITRSESIDPRSLHPARPETLAKRQKEYRLLKLKQIAEYSANPMYAVMLDVDCIEYHPEQISVENFIKKQNDAVYKDFLPILEKL